ncbi:MAG: AAA family ATPase [Candidatus Binatus sp.]|uniref:AAA family ATPase n=1 Tax=Candidatus Binatus sp. TaxID=2811406 RepID=UPI003C75C1AB
MRIESVTAHAFGPFVEGVLELVPCLNVIYGPNESGKSSWHAAIYAALCGMRRGRGAMRSEDQRFKDLHEPWSSKGWTVSARIRLEDGRTIEMRQDLAGLVDCRAWDVGLGRDVSSEIIFDGTPDASRWLGLDRHAFIATACVRQAELLEVSRNPEMLQEHLQRAADTAGKDETAAKALQLIDEFLRERVGQDRVNANKPLRTAVVRLREATEKLERARREHRVFLELAARCEAATATAASLDHQLRLLEAASAMQEAAWWSQRSKRALELDSRYRNGAPPALQDEELQHEVSSAITEWEKRPTATVPPGHSASELRQQIAALPAVPKGDRSPQPQVLDADSAYRDAKRKLELHAQTQPRAASLPTAVTASAEELRGIAYDLSISEPSVAPQLETQSEQIRAKLRRSRRIFQLIAIGAVGGAISCGYAAIEGHLLSAIVLGLSTIAMSLFAFRLRVSSLGQLVKQNQETDLARESAKRARSEWSERIANARSKAEVLGLEPKPGSLRTVADQVDRARAQAQEVALWQRNQLTLVNALQAAKAALSRALTDRGIDASKGPEEGVAAYVLACQVRATLAMQSNRQSDLENQLTMREAAEAAATAAENGRVKATRRIAAAATRCQIPEATDEATIVSRLRAWLGSRTKAAIAYQAAFREWAELQELLGGGTIADLQTEAIRREKFANEQRAGIKADELTIIQIESDQVRQIERLRKEHRKVRSDADELRGQLGTKASQLIAVSDAEEEFEAATSHLAAVRRLEQTLNATKDFLLRAQEQVHRTIAPVLAATVRAWLPKVTAARYVDVAVDPEDLSVLVRDAQGEWRNAAWLSRGTSEQIFLLLRVAMATRLTRAGEVCPLILDDVTVQFDNNRTEEVLGVLQAISSERQVILFTKEHYVLAWAKKNLRPSIDCLRTLDIPTSSKVVSRSWWKQ